MAIMTPPRPVLACTSSDGTEKNQTCKDEGPMTLDRSKIADEEISAHGVGTRGKARAGAAWPLHRHGAVDQPNRRSLQGVMLC